MVNVYNIMMIIKILLIANMKLFTPQLQKYYYDKSFGLPY